ncbi:MAG TPA: HEAT repeat domain-containing protein [Polyangiaceae bacterium]
MTDEHILRLALFLGANSAAWTLANRGRLRDVLVGWGEAVIEPVVNAMSSLPRTDIQDECELVLCSLPLEAAPSLRRLLELGQPAIARGAKATVLRAVARLDERGSLEAVCAALDDPEAEVRDAAASILGEMGSASNRALLERRLAGETDKVVRATIVYALESLQGLHP